MVMCHCGADKRQQPANDGAKTAASQLCRRRFFFHLVNLEQSEHNDYVAMGWAVFAGI